jgi:hypothetical protein
MSLEDLSFEQRDELALLMKDMAENPSTRKEVLRLTKKLRPNMPILNWKLKITLKRKSTMQKNG